MQHNFENHEGFSANDKSLRNLGSIYTPLDLANYLTSWAIQEPNCKVLDLGVGDGIFVMSAYSRLLNLGESGENARLQIYGAEKHTPAFENFLKVSSTAGVKFPYIYSSDFFDIEFPPVDAVIGNPPYVRRMYLDSIDQLRESVFSDNTMNYGLQLSRLTDLYVYFLLRACKFLKPGGRLAVVVADSWLNVGYGHELKNYLKEFYHIEKIISFDQNFFGAEVKPVLLLATKKVSITKNETHLVNFIRIKNGDSIDILKQSTQQLQNHKNATISLPKQVELETNKPWSIYFKTPELYDFLASHELMSSFSEQGKTRLGIQTLAKEFFVLTSQDATALKIEPEFLFPLAHSLKSTQEPVIETSTKPSHYLFYCSKDKGDIEDSKALKYILEGESKEVLVRGKNRTIIGYQNKARIQQDSRANWYDLKSKTENRGVAHILIPRLVYKNFFAVWNKAQFIPGELFIEFILPLEEMFEIEVYLAILSSSINEVILRTQAQIYGGGLFNISPGQIKNAPMINVKKLTILQKQRLVKAYHEYISTFFPDKSVLDKVIFDILGLDASTQVKIENLAQDLQLIATSTRKSASKREA